MGGGLRRGRQRGWRQHKLTSFPHLLHLEEPRARRLTKWEEWRESSEEGAGDVGRWQEPLEVLVEGAQALSIFLLCLWRWRC